MATQIQPLPDGPLKVNGGFELLDAEGKTIEAPATAYLCRCGQSSKKPFCDGAHKKAGFKSE